VNTSNRRYNAGVQRGKGLLELAAAPYDGSLSFESTRGGPRHCSNRFARRFSYQTLSDWSTPMPGIGLIPYDPARIIPVLLVTSL